MQINALAAHQSGEALKPYNFEPKELQNYDCLIKVLAFLNLLIGQIILSTSVLTALSRSWAFLAIL